MPVKVQIPKLKCQRCGHEWVPRQPEVKICPKCKSKYWNVPKEGGRKQE